MSIKSNIRKYGAVKVKEMSLEAWENIAGISENKYITKVTGSTITDAVVFTEITDEGTSIDWVDANQLSPYCIPLSFVEIQSGEME